MAVTLRTLFSRSPPPTCQPGAGPWWGGREVLVAWALSSQLLGGGGLYSVQCLGPVVLLRVTDTEPLEVLRAQVRFRKGPTRRRAVMLQCQPTPPHPSPRTSSLLHVFYSCVVGWGPGSVRLVPGALAKAPCSGVCPVAPPLQHLLLSLLPPEPARGDPGPRVQGGPRTSESSPGPLEPLPGRW